MSRFYGSIQGNRGEATRCGHTSYEAIAAGWGGAIKTKLSTQNGQDYFSVWMIPWGSKGGDYILLASGRLDIDHVRDGLDVVRLNKQLVDRFTTQLATQLMQRED